MNQDQVWEALGSPSLRGDRAQVKNEDRLLGEEVNRTNQFFGHLGMSASGGTSKVVHEGTVQPAILCKAIIILNELRVHPCSHKLASIVKAHVFLTRLQCIVFGGLVLPGLRAERLHGFPLRPVLRLEVLLGLKQLAGGDHTGTHRLGQLLGEQHRVKLLLVLTSVSHKALAMLAIIARKVIPELLNVARDLVKRPILRSFDDIPRFVIAPPHLTVAFAGHPLLRAEGPLSF
mmetsp:Transcript_16288/g.28472  ORF Transcript_16288/g.28472 Transcript_16288/m.28472 type:complete len:232 (-) Transcript_16288:471-1166(-)